MTIGNAYVAVEVPKGITYKECAEERNNKISSLLSDLLAKRSDPIFPESVLSETVAIGPNLWSALMYSPSMPKPDEFRALFNYQHPSLGRMNLQGKRLPKSYGSALSKALLAYLPSDTSFQVRKLNSKELAYYWSIIPYDIEEPIFALEADSVTFIADLDSSDKLFFLEETENIADDKRFAHQVKVAWILPKKEGIGQDPTTSMLTIESLSPQCKKYFSIKEIMFATPNSDGKPSVSPPIITITFSNYCSNKCPTISLVIVQKDNSLLSFKLLAVPNASNSDSAEGNLSAQMFPKKDALTPDKWLKAYVLCE